jgi:hypothetical protein
MKEKKGFSDELSYFHRKAQNIPLLMPQIPSYPFNPELRKTQKKLILLILHHSQRLDSPLHLNHRTNN